MSQLGQRILLPLLGGFLLPSYKKCLICHQACTFLVLVSCFLYFCSAFKAIVIFSSTFEPCSYSFQAYITLCHLQGDCAVVFFSSLSILCFAFVFKPVGNYGDQNGWGAVHVPLPAFLNQTIGTQTVGLFYPTHEQLTRKEKDVEEVRMLRESSTSTTPKPKLTDTSPGKGYWKRQLAHLSAHLEAFTQKDSEFRAEIGAPKMGKVRRMVDVIKLEY